MQVEGQHVVITGGSQGIGAAMAQAFARAGATVTVAARSADKLAAVAAEIGGNVFPVDLTDEAAVDGFVSAVESEFGPIDILVNNAGIETTSLAAVIGHDEIRRCNRLNVEAPEILTRQVLPGMLARGHGHLVYVSSIAGTVATPAMAHYGGSKAAILNFAGGVRRELAHTPVNVTVVSPGPVDTEMWDQVEAAPPTAVRVIRRFQRLRLLPTSVPDDVAELAVAAVLEDKRHVRLPRRMIVNYLANELPRRLVEIVSVGIKVDPLEPNRRTAR